MILLYIPVSILYNKINSCISQEEEDEDDKEIDSGVVDYIFNNQDSLLSYVKSDEFWAQSQKFRNHSKKMDFSLIEKLYRFVLFLFLFFCCIFGRTAFL